LLTQDSLVLLIIFLLFLALHAWTAYATSVMSNIRRMPLTERAEAGDPVARRVLKLSDRFTQFFSTMNLLQWFARVGMAVAITLALGAPLLEAARQPDASPLPFVLFVLLLIPGTLLVLWLSATLPNVYGIARADQAAPLVSLTAGPIMAIMGPLVSLTHTISNWAARIFGAEGMDKAVTEEEIIALVDSGQRGGAIETGEKEMIYSVLQFGETLVREVMIPRPDMVAVPAESSLQEALRIFIESGHSRAPVFEDDLDDVKGMLYAKDLLPVWHRGEQPPAITSLMRLAYFVPETKRADILFKEMKQRKIHIAIVVDEYGGTAGLVTIEDLLEEIVGDIRDEFDIHEEAEYTQIGDAEYVVDGAINLGDFNELLEVDVPDEENDSIGGHIYSLIGRVPEVGEVIEDPEHRLHMVIERVENRRIRKIRVTVLPSPGDDDEQEAEDEPVRGRSKANGTAKPAEEA
jgi:putative hemolysin